MREGQRTTQRAGRDSASQPVCLAACLSLQAGSCVRACVCCVLCALPLRLPAAAANGPAPVVIGISSSQTAAAELQQVATEAAAAAAARAKTTTTTTKRANEEKERIFFTYFDGASNNTTLAELSSFSWPVILVAIHSVILSDCVSPPLNSLLSYNSNNKQPLIQPKLAKYPSNSRKNSHY